MGVVIRRNSSDEYGISRRITNNHILKKIPMSSAENTVHVTKGNTQLYFNLNDEESTEAKMLEKIPCLRFLISFYF